MVYWALCLTICLNLPITNPNRAVTIVSLKQLSGYSKPPFRGDEPVSTVLERITDIVVDKLGVDADDVDESSSFQDDLGADSLDLVELIMAFEEEFSTDDNAIEIPDEDAGEIHTISDAVEYLKGKGVADG